MNIIKVTKASYEIGDAGVGIFLSSSHIVAQVKDSNASQPDATKTHKFFSAAGLVVAEVYKDWPQLKPDVLELITGVKDLIAAFKEPGPSPDDLRKLKDFRRPKTCEVPEQPQPQPQPDPGGKKPPKAEPVLEDPKEQA